MKWWSLAVASFVTSVGHLVQTKKQCLKTSHFSWKIPTFCFLGKQLHFLMNLNDIA